MQPTDIQHYFRPQLALECIRITHTIKIHTFPEAINGKLFLGRFPNIRLIASPF